MNTQPENTYVFSSESYIDVETDLPMIRLRCDHVHTPERSIQIAIAPTYGSNILEFKVGADDVFYTDKQTVREGKWTGCFILWPLPNRYDYKGEKAYVYQDKKISLQSIQRKEGNKPLIHGLVDDQHWSVDEVVQTSESISVSTHIRIDAQSPLFQFFPFPSQITLQFVVIPMGFKVVYTVTNEGQSSMPSVFALHPYYRLLSGREQTRVYIPAQHVMKATSDLLPTGTIIPVQGTPYDLTKPQAVAGMMFDDVWTTITPGLSAGIEFPTKGYKVSHVVTEDFTHVVYYSQRESDAGFICLEPQTGSTNAINLDTLAQETQDKDLRKAAHLIEIPVACDHSGTVFFKVEDI